MTAALPINPTPPRHQFHGQTFESIRHGLLRKRQLTITGSSISLQAAALAPCLPRPLFPLASWPSALHARVRIKFLITIRQLAATAAYTDNAAS